MIDDTKSIGAVLEPVDAWADLNPTQRSPSFVQRVQPSPETLEIIGDLGLRFPPANSVDREAHAARVYLLAEDCADIDPVWLKEAASEWAKTKRFLPNACELRESANAMARLASRPVLPAPKVDEAPAPKPAPPLTDEEIKRMPGYLVRLGIKMGDIELERAQRLRGATEDDAA